MIKLYSIYHIINLVSISCSSNEVFLIINHRPRHHSAGDLIPSIIIYRPIYPYFPGPIFSCFAVCPFHPLRQLPLTPLSFQNICVYIETMI